MGTVEKIVDTLSKMGQDKRNMASARYMELSSWLKHEMSLIRTLIEASPSISNSSSSGQGGNPVDDMIIDDTLRPSMSVNGSPEDKRQKRKSPETRQIGTSSGESPDQKRSSLDYEELAIAANLPPDLNKLQKKELVEELEKRGCFSLSSRSLKKELVVALRSLLVEESQKGSVSTVAADQSTCDPQADAVIETVHAAQSHTSMDTEDSLPSEENVVDSSDLPPPPASTTRYAIVTLSSMLFHNTVMII